MVTIKTFVEGPVDANNYLIIDDESKEAVLIDCSSSRDEFINSIKAENVNLKYILLTHGHFDHLLGVDGFKDAFDNVKVFVSKDDDYQVKMLPDMLRMFGGFMSAEVPGITNFLQDGDEFNIGKTSIKVISTPGHTEGGVCYLIGDKLFSGDTLFYGSIGRCDLPGGNMNTIADSIKNKLFVLDENIEVYPGHGPKTTLGFEKKYNDIINY